MVWLIVNIKTLNFLLDISLKRFLATDFFCIYIDEANGIVKFISAMNSGAKKTNNTIKAIKLYLLVNIEIFTTISKLSGASFKQLPCPLFQ